MRSQYGAPQILKTYDLVLGDPGLQPELQAAGFPCHPNDCCLVTSEDIRGRWPGFRLELIGVRCRDMPTGLDWGLFTTDGEPCFVAIAAYSLHYRESPAWWERHWRRSGWQRPQFKGKPYELSEDAWHQLGRGRALLKGVVAGLGGRPSKGLEGGTDPKARLAFAAEMQKAVDSGKSLTWITVNLALGWDQRSVGKELKWFAEQPRLAGETTHQRDS